MTNPISSIKAGDRVTIINRFGQQRIGTAVMKGPYGWVLNMGGQYGTPAIATDENTVSVRRTLSIRRASQVEK